MKAIRIIVKSSIRLLVYFIIFVMGYLSVAWTLSRIVTPSEQTSEAKTITAYIKSNNVHTDLVLPVRNEDMDWSTLFPYNRTRSRDTAMRYVALGWGDKGFYLNTPTWADLTASTAFKAVFGLSTTALHVTYYPEMKPDGKTCIQLKMTRKQYQRVKQYVLQTLVRKSGGKTVFIPTKAVYGDHDAFYDARGTYSLFSTCNSWTNVALKQAGQKAALWTPFEFGVFQAYRK